MDITIRDRNDFASICAFVAIIRSSRGFSLAVAMLAGLPGSFAFPACLVAQAPIVTSIAQASSIVPLHMKFN